MGGRPGRIPAQRLLGPERVAVQGGALRLDAEPDEAARINRELVTAGIAVSALGWDEPTLEDVFLEMTGVDRLELAGAGREV